MTTRLRRTPAPPPAPRSARSDDGGIDADEFLNHLEDVGGVADDAPDPFAPGPGPESSAGRLGTGRLVPNSDGAARTDRSRESHGLPRPTVIKPATGPDRAVRGRTAVMERPLDTPDPRRVREGRQRPAIREVRRDLDGPDLDSPGLDSPGLGRSERAIDDWLDEPRSEAADGWFDDEAVIPTDEDGRRNGRRIGRRDREPAVPGGRRRGIGYKLGLLALVGISIWLVVTLLSPTTLVDTENLPEDAGLAAVETEPNAPPARFASDGSVISSGDETIQIDGGAGATPAAGVDAEGEATGEVAEQDAGADTDTENAAATEGDETTSTTAAAGQDSDGNNTAAGGVTGSLDYRSNLEMIQGATVRNRNHDDSAHADTPSAELNPSNHYGPRSEYLNNPGGNPEQSFPIPAGGQFRVACEFSHFSYDDPLIFPGKPGAAHLHMFFGNTNVNAFSNYDSLINTGSSTCNGQELNRTGYWVPAMFDGQGNVRIPERIVVYYKGEGRSRGNTIPYPEGAAMVINDNLNDVPDAQGGAPGKASFVCSENFSGATGQPSETMPACDGSLYKNRYGVDDDPRVVLEVNIKFPQCWNGQDPSNIDNFRPPESSWYGSNCTGEYNRNLPNLEYFVNYPVAIGENTSDWFLSSDVDPTSFGASKATGGSTIHGDWWGGWHKETNQMWVDNCVNYADGSPSGCGFGYLTNGGSNGGAPAGGPALKMRPQYTGPIKVSAEQILRELCPDPNKAYSKPEDAAYCAPGTGL